MGHVAVAGLIARAAARDQDDVIAQAAAAAAEADVAVVVVGLTEEQEAEAVDKTTLKLPGRQDEMIRAVAAAATKTVVIVNAATPILMPWLSQVDAVLWAGLPGQEAGHAVAAALLGDIEPAGRLVTTFPEADGAAPAWEVTPVAGALAYTEGTFVGYRGHYAGSVPDPAFWFGHGLGYGSWTYSNAYLTENHTGATDVTVTVTTTSDRASREVVQLYFQPDEPDQPIRLVGWQAIAVPARRTTQVTVTGDPRMWRRWNPRLDGWETVGPGGRLLLARGLGDIRARIDLSAPE